MWRPHLVVPVAAPGIARAGERLCRHPQAIRPAREKADGDSAPGQSDCFPLAVPAPVHATVVFGGLLPYVLLTRVRRRHRHPSAAFAWVITIAFLTYLGMPLFLLFGAGRLGRPQHRHARAGVDAVRDAPCRAGTLPAGPGLPLCWLAAMLGCLTAQETEYPHPLRGATTWLPTLPGRWLMRREMGRLRKRDAAHDRRKCD